MNNHTFHSSETVADEFQMQDPKTKEPRQVSRSKAMLAVIGGVSAGVGIGSLATYAATRPASEEEAAEVEEISADAVEVADSSATDNTTNNLEAEADSSSQSTESKPSLEAEADSSSQSTENAPNLEVNDGSQTPENTETPENTASESEDEPLEMVEIDNPYGTIEQVFNPYTAPQATSVNSQMSFPEAFAAARAELGPGGVFEWNGQLYGTFYETEVDANGNPTIDYPTLDETNDLHEVSNNSSAEAFNPLTAPQATGVSDQMSFAQAFATARAELGPGGVFEWNGQLYGTFYATEVDANGNPTVEYNIMEIQEVEPTENAVEDYEEIEAELEEANDSSDEHLNPVEEVETIPEADDDFIPDEMVNDEDGLANLDENFDDLDSWS